MFNFEKSLTVITEAFPARSETFVQAHVCGMTRRGWKVNTMARAVGPGVSEAELNVIDALSVKRIYSRVSNDSKLRRLGRIIAALLRDPSVVRYWNGSSGLTREEMLTIYRMKSFLKHSPSQQFHVHFGHIAARLSAVGWNRPTVVTWHGFDANVFPRYRGDHIYRDLFSRSWTHTVGSTFMYRRLVELGAQKDRLVKIPMGVDLTRFQFVDRSNRTDSKLKIVSVGRLHEMKGHAYLIEGISRAKSKGIVIECSIIGEGPTRRELESLIQGLGLTSTVKLLGAQSQSTVVNELAEADVFALTGVVTGTGFVETQGVAYIEAQATGLPVIAADVGGVSESLVAGRTGFLVRSKDVDAIEKALLAYAQDPSLRLVHGKVGSEFVRKKFDVTTMLESFEKLYADSTNR